MGPLKSEKQVKESQSRVAPLYLRLGEGRGMTGCLGRHVPYVLLDNGFSLNVCLLATAIALGYGPTDFEPSTQTVRAYDSTHRVVIGTLTLELMIGLVVY